MVALGYVMKLRRDRVKRSQSPRARPWDRTERALKAQAETLNKHEATIARHTGLQTWVAALTTVVLASITWMQYRAGEREVALEYAKTANQYTVGMTYQSGYGDTVAGPYGMEPITPIEIAIKRDSGLGTIGSVDVYQTFKIGSDPVMNETDCEVVVTNWFEQTSPGSLELRLNPDRTRLLDKTDIVGPMGAKGQFTASTTIIVVEFRDVFGNSRRDILTGMGSSFSLVQGSQEPVYKFARMTAMLLTNPAPYFMAFEPTVEPAECAPWVRPYKS